MSVAQRPCRSGVPPRSGRAGHRSVLGHRGTASRRDAAPTADIHFPGRLMFFRWPLAGRHRICGLGHASGQPRRRPTGVQASALDSKWASLAGTMIKTLKEPSPTPDYHGNDGSSGPNAIRNMLMSRLRDGNSIGTPILQLVAYRNLGNE